MKASGRRRFRKMNARFRQRGSAVVRERARTTSAGEARKLILNDFWGGDPSPLPSRPFTPRSLVGMSQSAKKRRAAIEFWRGLQPYEFARKLPTDPAAKRFDLKCALTFRIGGADYQAVRAKYRIGERLRPCPGCTACLVCIACENDTCKRRHLKNQHCDGSGVLPARKS